MEASVRTFLMVRADDGTWMVTVCRNLDTVTRTWEARKEPDRDVAVLHVGFDHPPSRVFDEIADAHPGQMLLTAAAKYSLPNSFIVSAAPVALIEGNKVFIGLQEWGHSLEDPTAQADLPEVSRTEDISLQEPQGWVASFLMESPSAAETFSTIGIYNDSSYLEREAELERDVRHLSGVFRTHQLVGANYDDPCELACAAPPWLTERNLITLDLPLRAIHVFRTSEINIVRDLADWSSNALLMQPNFGQKSLKDTLQALNAALNEGPLSIVTAVDTNEPSQLLTEARRALLSFSDRERDILVRRLGFETIPETLQQIADDYNVTRECIKQIEARTTAKWIHNVFRAHQLVDANDDDPCELARAAPPWLAERDLTTLGLPLRAINIFRANEINTVRDLAGWSSEALLKLLNFGQKSLKDTLQALNTALNEGRLRIATAVDTNGPSQLLTEVRRSLLSFSDRERDILVRRLGFETIPETLQQVADDYNVTRECIKQIEARTTAKWIRNVFRAHQLIGANYDDPCELARAAPPWLAEWDVTTLDLPLRVIHVFRTSEINTVRDLADWSSNALLMQPNFGQKSLKDTLQALNTALNEGRLRIATAVDTNEPSHLLTEIRRSLLSFSDRDRDILVRRLGFETIPETLQRIADDYNVTRERIRQVEVRTTAKWIRKSYWNDILEQKVTRLLIGRVVPLPVAGVEAIDPWFRGVPSDLKFFRDLVQTACKGRIHFVDIGGLCYFSLMDQEYWIRLVSEAKALLSSGVGQEWTEEYAYSLVQSLLSETSREFGQLLWDKSSRFCYFSTGLDGSRVLTSYGRGADPLVEAVLAESDTPLHYTKIAERANVREGKSLDPRRAHSAAASVGFLFARGTYGLARHVSFSADQMLQVRTEAEEIICADGSGRQWHTSEILSELSGRLNDGFEGLDKYVLDIALSKSEILNPLGKMTWVETGQDTHDGTRIDIHQAVISLVKAAGHPLSTNEIKECLRVVRGISEFFQISPIDPLVRMKPGVWGINDRDVPLSREDQRELVEELVRKLEAAQSGFHTSELCNVLSLRDCPLDAFLSIAIPDQRLRKGLDQYVYLTEWGDSRRETIRHAVFTVLEKAGKPLTLEEILALVERRVGRKCEMQVVSHTVQALEAEFNEVTGEWSL